MTRTIAVIPAKGRSRRVPNKNMRPLGGKPLIYYTIAALKESSLVDEIYVSTDSPEIADYVKSIGCLVPFLRNESLSGDNVHGTEPVLDMLRRLEWKIDESVFCLRALPPYPFISSKSIDELISKSHQASKNVLSVVPLDVNIYHLKKYNDDGTISPATDKSAMNFQIDDAPELFALCGAIQCMPAIELLRAGTFHAGSPIGHTIGRIEGFEVDTMDAFSLAEKLLPLLGSAQ